MESLNNGGEQNQGSFFYGENLEEQFPFDPEKARFERLKVGVAIEMAGSKRAFLERRKNGEITDDEEKEYFRNIDRPVDNIANGYHGIDEDERKWRACNARFNLDVSSGKINPKHYRRILGFFSGMKGDDISQVSRESAQRFGNYESVDGGMYKEFLEKYPTIMDFDRLSEDFVAEIVRSNSKERGDDYKRDMATFRNMVYGKEQIKAYEAIKALNSEAEEYGADRENVDETGPWRKEWERSDGNESNEVEPSGQLGSSGEEEGVDSLSVEEINNEVAADEFDNEIKVGDRIHGYRVVVAKGFEKVDPDFPILPGQGYEEYNGKYYIVQKK